MISGVEELLFICTSDEPDSHTRIMDLKSYCDGIVFEQKCQEHSSFDSVAPPELLGNGETQKVH